MFLNSSENTCMIYKSRPIQCQVFECWRPQKLIDISRERRLSRVDIIDDHNIMTLITAHEERVPLHKFISALESGNKETTLEMINYDIHFREFLSEKGVFKHSEMPFYLGRPLLGIARQMGYKLDITNE